MRTRSDACDDSCLSPWPPRRRGALGAGDAAAADKLRVVTTTTDLKALTEAVGGDLVEVDALARGNQNPHDLEVRPSLMVKVRRADLLVINGLELDQWAEVVVQGANNPKVHPRRARARRRLRGHPGPRGADHAGGPLHGRRPSGRQPALHARSGHGARPSPRTSSRGWRGSRPHRGRPSSGIAPSSWPARPGDDAAGPQMLAPFRGAKVVQYHPRLRLPAHALRPGQGRRRRGAARHPADARVTWSASSSR